ncbi:chromosome segregation and condensation protein ScpA [Desulforamulus profundi]|uniref:Segregation and condensation protein A n=1 Tax=Desulforamulus profundi TaxID=1383067 RepID=A0A2C6L1V4_9FIRM|nr:segregation/condensation protein A [Desulforamulus profundi]PHJ37431.1 chromosome segregation and condensation protein ScpA [Desulforamulus profundi]
MSYEVKLSAFEGPLDLLLHLIDKDQINIYDIPIAQITSQYLAYIEQMQGLDMDVASEFLVMAATLVSIKARMLLPRSSGKQEAAEEGPDPREELVQRLLEYRKFKEVASYLKDREKQAGKVYTRNNSIELYQHLFKPQDPLGGITMETLLQSLRQALQRAGAGLFIPEEITREEIQVPEKMRQLMAMLLLYPQGMPFSRLFNERGERTEIIVTFLAVLELLKSGQITAIQTETFGEITILRRAQDLTEEA